MDEIHALRTGLRRGAVRAPAALAFLASALWSCAGPTPVGSDGPSDLPGDAAAGPEGPLEEVACGEPGVRIDLHRPDEVGALVGCTRLLGELRVGDAPLTGVAGLESLRRIDGVLNFFRNPDLVDLGGLRNLEEVGGGLFIHHNPRLEDLGGLERLRSVGEKLLISNNRVLRSVEGLGGLQSVAGDVQIIFNSQLPTDQAEALVARLEVEGTTEVSGNSP